MTEVVIGKLEYLSLDVLPVAEETILEFVLKSVNPPSSSFSSVWKVLQQLGIVLNIKEVKLLSDFLSSPPPTFSIISKQSVSLSLGSLSPISPADYTALPAVVQSPCYRDIK